jgi:hypothetical protein
LALNTGDRMRNAVFAAWAATMLAASLAHGAERPAWLPERPDTYLAELLAQGGRVVAVLPAPPPIRLPREVTDARDAPPVVVFVQLGSKLFRCPDSWDWTEGPNGTQRRQTVPGRCEIPIPRQGWPFATQQPEQRP